MKSPHLFDTDLNDFVEGQLGAAAARRVEEHLEICAECRADAESLRSLLAGMRDLPREIPPSRDLFPEIVRTVGEAEAVPLYGRDWRRRALQDLRRPLAAAAVLLVALTAALTAWLLERRPGDPVAGVSPPSAVMPGADLTQVATDYEDAIRELSITLRERRSELDPVTIRLVEENLLVIDQAIRESRAALAADPANQVLEQLVVAGYEQKLELLRRAARSTES
jgi:hypothetical protein